MVFQKMCQSCATCWWTCWGAIVSYIRTKRGGLKLAIFILALVASILTEVTFVQDDKKLLGSGGFEFVIAATNFV